MRTSLFYTIFALVACLIYSAQAAPDSIHAPDAAMPDKGHRPILIVEFSEKMQPGTKLSDAIEQSKREFTHVESTILAHERDLVALMESKEESNLGMVILIAPQNHELIATLPGLYPDIFFTTIDMKQPLFANNVQSVQFKEQDGMYLLGTIASMRSNGKISILALDKDDRTQRLTSHFVQGVKASKKQPAVSSVLGIRPTAENRTRLATTIADAFTGGSDIIFSADDEIVEQALRTAKQERKLVIAGDTPPASADNTRLLTYLVKRYDLALLDVLRIYHHNQWRAGTIELGVSGGYVDYSLNADNVELFPKEFIDEIETIKDYLGQGVINTSN